MHHQRIISESSVHHLCIIITSPVHHQCIITASLLCIHCWVEPSLLLSSYPNLPIFLHGYIRHIRDISQLWIWFKELRSTGPFNFIYILPTVCLNCNWFFGNFTAAAGCFQLVPKYKLKGKLLMSKHPNIFRKMGAEVTILANPYTYNFLKGLTHSALHYAAIL